MKPFISVVIPTYNHAFFLRRALQSVLDQKYDNFEVLVIDNHSDDNTDEVVLGFNDARIRLLKIYNHGVIAASRNYGIKGAKGDWIAFLDSDDHWYSTKFTTVLGSLKSSDQNDVVITDEIMVNHENGKQKILRYGPYTKDFYKTMLLYGNRLSPSATLVRRTFLMDNNLLFREDECFVTVEDYDLWLRLALADAKFKFIHSVEGEYTVHGDNSSLKMGIHQNNLKNLLRDHVLNIQKFEKDVEMLWDVFESQRKLVKLLKSIRYGVSFTLIQQILHIILIYPKDTFKNILNKVQRFFFEFKMFLF